MPEFVGLLGRLTQGWWYCRDADAEFYGAHPGTCLAFVLGVSLTELEALVTASGLFSAGNVAARRIVALGPHQSARVQPGGFDSRFAFLCLGDSPTRSVQEQLALPAADAPPRLRGPV